MPSGTRSSRSSPSSPTSPTVGSTHASALSERSAHTVPDPLTPAAVGGVAVGDVLAHESGLEIKARSQWAYARIRFFRHKLAVASLVVLIAVTLIAVFAGQVAPYAYDEFDFEHIVSPPTTEGWHLFGTDQLGRDYLG